MRKSIILFLTAIWLGFVSLSFFWNRLDDKRENKEIALQTARAFFQLVMVARDWNIEYGPIYVPVTDQVQPNPHLTIPYRDLVTEKGKTLTLINAAYMTRQMGEISGRNEGVYFHITSLKPLRPGNRPAPWEKEWLQSFQKGATEQYALVQEGDRDVFRYMAPLIMKEGCLECHMEQGYKLGQNRGGISVTLPYFFQEPFMNLLLSHIFIGLIGCCGILLTGILLARRENKLIAAHQEREELIGKLQKSLQEIKTLEGILPLCSFCKKIRKDDGTWEQIDVHIREHSHADISHGICPDCMKEHYPREYKLIQDNKKKDKS